MNRWYRVAAILTLIAFVGATLGSLLPAALADTPCAMTLSGSSTADGQSDTSKSMPVCDGSLSCIIMTAMPATANSPSTSVVFNKVRYWPTTAAMAGLNIPPDPSPPRHSS